MIRDEFFLHCGRKYITVPFSPLRKGVLRDDEHVG